MEDMGVSEEGNVPAGARFRARERVDRIFESRTAVGHSTCLPAALAIAASRSEGSAAFASAQIAEIDPALGVKVDPDVSSVFANSFASQLRDQRERSLGLS